MDLPHETILIIIVRREGINKWFIDIKYTQIKQPFYNIYNVQ